MSRRRSVAKAMAIGAFKGGVLAALKNEPASNREQSESNDGRKNRISRLAMRAAWIYEVYFVVQVVALVGTLVVLAYLFSVL